MIICCPRNRGYSQSLFLKFLCGQESIVKIGSPAASVKQMKAEATLVSVLDVHVIFANKGSRSSEASTNCSKRYHQCG